MNQIRDSQCGDGTIGDGTTTLCCHIALYMNYITLFWVGNVVPSTDPRRDGPLPSGGNCSSLTGDATWDTVYPTIAHNIWQYYGAIGVIRDHWEHLQVIRGHSLNIDQLDWRYHSLMLDGLEFSSTSVSWKNNMQGLASKNISASLV
eukprot:SAG31_NODE_1508_length_8063_cov_3.156956_3_plen_147_part_00